MVRYQVRGSGVHLVSRLRSCRRKQRQEWYRSMVTSMGNFSDLNVRYGGPALPQSPGNSDRLRLEIVAHHSRCWQGTRQRILRQATLQILLSRLFPRRSPGHQERGDVPQRLRRHRRRRTRRRLQQPHLVASALLHNHRRRQLHKLHTRHCVEDLDPRRGAATVRRD